MHKVYNILHIPTGLVTQVYSETLVEVEKVLLTADFYLENFKNTEILSYTFYKGYFQDRDMTRQYLTKKEQEVCLLILEPRES